MEKMKENLKRQYEVIMTTEPKTQLKYHKLLEAVKNLNKKYQKLISKENMINKATDIYNQDGENSRKMYDKYFKEIPALEIDLTKTEEIFKRTFGVREGEHVINKINNKINEYVRNYKMKFLKNDETFWRIDDMDNLEKKPEQWEKMDNVPGIDDDEAVEIEEDSVDLHGRHPTRDDEPYHTVSRDPSRSARTSDPIFDDRVGLHGGPPSGLPSPPPPRGGGRGGAGGGGRMTRERRATAQRATDDVRRAAERRGLDSRRARSAPNSAEQRDLPRRMRSHAHPGTQLPHQHQDRPCITARRRRSVPT
jgi:hypothetical protein